jgi:hypothetical protein
MLLLHGAGARMAGLTIAPQADKLMGRPKKIHAVVPGRADGANPESSQEFGFCIWIPDRGRAASGMTGRGSRNA